MTLSSLFLIGVGFSMEALSLREWRRIGASHIPLVPPILIGIGAWQFPSATFAVRIGMAVLGVALHIAVPLICARGIVPRGKRSS